MGCGGAGWGSSGESDGIGVRLCVRWLRVARSCPSAAFPFASASDTDTDIVNAAHL